MGVPILDEESIYHAARAIADPGARAAYLARACAGDAALRGRVERLLRVCEHEPSFLELPACAVAPDTRGGSFCPGTAIGPYELLEQIGEGGMGVVYVAEQHQPVRRKVALKIIKPGMDTKQVVARFEAERQALAMMDHPNIARVHDGGTTESGRPFFVMELVRGLPITEYCDAERLSIRARLELFVLACRAVQHAHQKGIIHRDLKPSNILVTMHDGVPVPKVIDFGIAKATGGGLTEETIYTAFTQLVGTPLYMSPEQVELSGLDIDTRSDIYSLGVLLYELLTGTTPFDSEALRKAAFDEMRRIIREEEPPKPSTRLGTLGATLTATSAKRSSGPRHLNRSVRGELDWIAMRALEKDRRRRYETANDFATDVMRYLTDRPVEACPPSAWYRLTKYAGRNRVALTAAGAVSLALVVSTVIGVGQSLRATRAERQSEADRAEARTQRRRAERHSVATQLLLARRSVSAGQLGRARDILDELDGPPTREFPWLFVRRELARDALTPAWPDGQKRDMTFPSRDGSILAGFHRDGPVEFLERGTGRVIISVDGPRSHSIGWRGYMSYSPDGRHFAKSERGRVGIWEIATGQLVADLGPPTTKGLFRPTLLAEGRFLTYSRRKGDPTAPGTGEKPGPDWELWKLGADPAHPGFLAGVGNGYYLVRSSHDGRQLAVRVGHRILIRDALDGRVLRAWDSVPDVPGAIPLGFSGDGTILAEIWGKSSLVFWDTTTGTECGRLDLDRRVKNSSCVFSPDGRTCAVTENDLGDESATGAVTLWDRIRGRTHTIRPREGSGRTLVYPVFSPSGGQIALGVSHEGVQGPLTVWNVASGVRVATCPLPRPHLSGIHFLSDDRTLLLEGDSQTWIWRLDHLPLAGHADETWGVASSPDGRILASGSDDTEDDDTIKLWDAATGRLLRGWRAGAGTVAALDFSPDGKTVASAQLAPAANVRLWDVADGRLRATLEGHTDNVRTVAFSPDGKMLASAGSDRTVRLWDAAAGRSLATLAGHTDAVRGVAFSRDGRQLASASNDRTVRLWDVATRRETRVLRSSERLNAVAFSPDGSVLAAADQGGNIPLWGTASGDPRGTFLGDGTELFALAFAPDGRTLAAAGSGRAIRIWDVLTGQELLALPGHSDRINGLAYSPDGRSLASCSHDGAVKLWCPEEQRPPP